MKLTLCCCRQFSSLINALAWDTIFLEQPPHYKCSASVWSSITSLKNRPHTSWKWSTHGWWPRYLEYMISKSIIGKSHLRLCMTMLDKRYNDDGGSYGPDFSTGSSFWWSDLSLWLRTWLLVVVYYRLPSDRTKGSPQSIAMNALIL